MKSNLKRYSAMAFRSWGFSLIMAILIATSFKSSLADWNDVPTGSMLPTILIGDRIVVNKLAYDLKLPYTTYHLAEWADPQRGDIVVFFSPENGERLVKRVIGTPGDTIAMRENRLFINGTFLNYSPLEKKFKGLPPSGRGEGHRFFSENLTGRRHPVMLSPSRPSLTSFGPLTVPAGHYFMMGDNRDNSADSRYFGFVERSAIVGRATTVALSREESFLHPRWSRFLKALP